MGALDGKVALISGGARGQGAAEAKLFVAQGAKVVIGDLLDAEGAELARSIGDACTYVHLDVTSEEDWARAVETAVLRYGSLSVLVNNAGISPPGTVESTSRELFMKIVEVNQLGVFLGMKAAVPALKKQGGSIVNISSTAGMMGSRVSVAYTGTKWAVRGMTKSVAQELAPFGIRVNSVHPGVIVTDMTKDFIDEGRLDGHRAKVPMQRFGQPEEIANLVLFLASDASSYSTGSEFIADGGLIL